MRSSSVRRRPRRPQPEEFDESTEGGPEVGREAGGGHAVCQEWPGVAGAEGSGLAAGGAGRGWPFGRREGRGASGAAGVPVSGKRQGGRARRPRNAPLPLVAGRRRACLLTGVRSRRRGAGRRAVRRGGRAVTPSARNPWGVLLAAVWLQPAPAPKFDSRSIDEWPFGADLGGGKRVGWFHSVEQRWTLSIFAFEGSCA